MKSRSESSPDVCLRCGDELEFNEVERIRVGGSTGGWKMLLGEIAELGEGMIDLELWACPRCRMVEFRLPGGE